MQVVIQEEETGCGLASVANILGCSYAQVRQLAAKKGIFAADTRLWSETGYVRDLLEDQGVRLGADQQPFVSWEALPDTALLAIKHHREGDRDFWHWVVFKRRQGEARVLDSAAYLESNLRQDWEGMQPRWFIEVYDN
ncbi:hypothetical protein [Marinospirillum perlucidum]|uniref:hypothetical protein n=1 Tax=Marinospirillum perlucidum TaxID=1982602 RepID=UPI000DF47964|nr:hypothetical protein [Marinospirillum perlucidum]